MTNQKTQERAASQLPVAARRRAASFDPIRPARINPMTCNK
jgi:hypothetical protein